LGAKKLQEVDKDIAISYQEYKAVYDSTPLEEGIVNKLSALAKSNYLFLYLFASFNRDIGWIDFEKELSVIIDEFRDYLLDVSLRKGTKARPRSDVGQYILGFFNYFYQQYDTRSSYTSHRVINEEYILEYPRGSFIKVINKDKVVETLEKQLQELADGLRLYLQCFVENIVVRMSKTKILQQYQALTGAKHVVTFNYTNTYELIYPHEKVYHIHGNVKDRIILGVNPNEADELSAIDVTFLRFKKYFQRVIYHSDDAYLAWVTKEKDTSLVVMGHSLDVTDKDVIMQMFSAAKDITVLYYNETAEASLV
jgi:hypothetical protein